MTNADAPPRPGASDGDSEAAAPARIAVAIVNYTTAALVLETLPRLLEDLAGRDFRVVIVDNASPNGDGALLARRLPEVAPDPRVSLVRSPVNGGFSYGNNRAFDAIRAMDWRPDAVLLLNPDACPRPGAIGAMLAVLAAHPSAGIVGPRLGNDDGSTWTAAFRFPGFGSEVLAALAIDALARRHRTLLPASEAPMRVDWVSGTAPLIRWSALEDIGPMDEGYFLYFEEVDFQREAGRRGWECWHAPGAVVDHVAGAATGIADSVTRQGPMPAYWFSSWARYFAKGSGPLGARLLAIGHLFATLFADTQRRLRGRPVNRPECYHRDFLRQVVLRRLAPPPTHPPPPPLAEAEAD